MAVNPYWQHFGTITERHLRKQNPKIIFRQLWRQTWQLDSHIICRGKGPSLSVHAWCDVTCMTSPKKDIQDQIQHRQKSRCVIERHLRKKNPNQISVSNFLTQGVEAFLWKCKNSLLELHKFLQIDYVISWDCRMSEYLTVICLINFRFIISIIGPWMI